MRADGAVGVVKGEAAIQGMPGRPSDWLTVGKVCAIWERYSGENDILTAAYASSIAHDLLAVASNYAGAAVASDGAGASPPRVDCWFHGHVRVRADYRIGATRMICNAHGYADEVPAFDPRLIVEIPS